MSRALKGLHAGLATLLLLAVQAAPAPADPAQAFSYDYCQTSDSTTFCASGHSVYKSTPTPSGNYIFVVNDKYQYSSNAPGCSFANTGQDHSTYLLTADQFKQSHVVQSFDFTQSCFGVTQQCTFYNNVAVANGELRAENSYYVCEPPS